MMDVIARSFNEMPPGQQTAEPSTQSNNTTPPKRLTLKGSLKRKATALKRNLTVLRVKALDVVWGRKNHTGGQASAAAEEQRENRGDRVVKFSDDVVG